MSSPTPLLEGPPTLSGPPHLGHARLRVLKDALWRHAVGPHGPPLVAGWDCHGLPVELAVERSGVSRDDPEAFVTACAAHVHRARAAWTPIVQALGCSMDLDAAWSTADPGFTDVVWGALARLNERGLLLRDAKVVWWWPRGRTVLSAAEALEGTRQAADPAAVVGFPLVGGLHGRDVALAAWTTAPWTLPACSGLAVPREGPLRLWSDGRQVLATANPEPPAPGWVGAGLADVAELWGRCVRTPLGLEVPVVADGLARADRGTGVVALAPDHAEADRLVARDHGLEVAHVVGDHGRYLSGPLAGQDVFEALPQLLELVRGVGALVAVDRSPRPVAFCWREPADRLLPLARHAWFLRSSLVAPRVRDQVRGQRWHPPGAGVGRLGELLRDPVDWALSRERLWGTPLNAWHCADCGRTRFPASERELTAWAGPLPDHPLRLHRPWLDRVRLACPCGGVARRVPETVDAWFDSGCVAQALFAPDCASPPPPAELVVEGIDQTRGWFHALLLVQALLHDDAGPPFAEALAVGHVVDEKGRKLSKRHGDMLAGLDTPDTLRLALLSVAPELPLHMDEGRLDEARTTVNRLESVASFLALYPQSAPDRPLEHPLDAWLLARVGAFVAATRAALARREPQVAVRELAAFADDLANWYVRRSRRRFWAGGEPGAQAGATLGEVLRQADPAIVPLVPGLAARWREVASGAPAAPAGRHRVLRGSPRACGPPGCPAAPAGAAAGSGPEEVGPLEAMGVVRELARLGLAERERRGVKARQPLARATVRGVPLRLLGHLLPLADLLRDALTVHAVCWEPSPLAEHALDIVVLPSLPRLGPRLGGLVPEVRRALEALPRASRDAVARGEGVVLRVAGQAIALEPQDLLVRRERVGGPRVELDLAVGPSLAVEALAREVLAELQASRRAAGFAVTDRVRVELAASPAVAHAVRTHAGWVRAEALVTGLAWVPSPAGRRVPLASGWLEFTLHPATTVGR